MNTLLDFDNTVPRPTKVSPSHTEELKTNKVERCRPRKILDYAVLAKGQGEYYFFQLLLALVELVN